MLTPYTFGVNTVNFEELSVKGVGEIASLSPW
ncbi:hypothetical protein JOF43_000888 [Brachybacterium sacelli]|uniref:Uncharacterized protein n=1 Tax=Brachybacterium sacelli TaxID=173364 RepID=A0ABS4WXK9_9MICO|nr:hypothetical protein [Brachybacterium sacelli]